MGLVCAHTHKLDHLLVYQMLKLFSRLHEKQESSSISVVYLLRACRAEKIHCSIPWKPTCLVTEACSGSYLGLIKATAMQITIYIILVENGCLKQIVSLKVIFISY